MGRRLACADLHGRYDLWLGILEYIQPDDKIYFLGDACDRGSAGWKMIKEIYNHPQFVYLKGNHEDMLVHALIEHFDDMYDGYYWYEMCMNNGGYQTFEDAIADPDVREWVKKIAALPLKETVDRDKGPVHLCHSGAITGNRKELIWDRDHFNYPYPYDDGGVIVHGHTPTPHVVDRIFDYDLTLYKQKGVVGYCEKEDVAWGKYCIDVGAVWKGYTVLMDLDTHEFIKIYAPEEIEYVRC